MALNYPGPWELRLFYSVNVSGQTLQHVAKYNLRVNGVVDPGTPFEDMYVIRKDGLDDTATGQMDAVTLAWVNVLRPRCPVLLNFDFAELWLYTPESFEAAFMSTMPIDLPGTGGGTPVAASQAIWTFRTIEGGILKVTILEAGIPGGASVSAGALSGADAAIRDAVIAPNSWHLGRDSSYAFSAIKYHPGQNEAVFKKRFRNL